MYKIGENSIVTPYLAYLEESSHRLSDLVADAIDEQVSAFWKDFGQTIPGPGEFESVENKTIEGGSYYPLVLVELFDGSGNLRGRWFDSDGGDGFPADLLKNYPLGKPFPDVLSRRGKVYVVFQRNLQKESGGMGIRGVAALEGAPFLSSLKARPESLVFVTEGRFFPIMEVTGQRNCLSCHPEKPAGGSFPVPHRGFIKGRGLFLSGSVKGSRFAIQPVALGEKDDSYLLIGFPSEETITSLNAFRRLLLPTWLLLCVVVALGTLILYRRLKDPERRPASEATDLHVGPRVSGWRESLPRKPVLRKGAGEAGSPPSVPAEAEMDTACQGDREMGDYRNLREKALTKIKELSGFLSAVNRITYPERLGETIVWNMMNIIPGELILLAVAGTAGPGGEYDVFCAQRFRKDSVAEMFIKKMQREFPSYVKNVIHTRVVDVERDSFFARYGVYKHGLKKGLLLPVEIRGVILGVLAIFRRGEDSFPSFDIELASVLAGHLGTVVENAKLHEEVKTNYFNTLRSLISSIEEKDRYRRGHSERVADIALSMADRAGLSKRRRNILFQSAILHDIGKISISPAILGKRGRLSDEEMRLVRQHPVIGYRIIEPLSFLKEVKACISEHHERCDGKGYPSGLSREGLTLEGRILAVADAFDSMISERPYRKAMTDREAISELQRNAGGQFDPGVVELFVSVYREKEAGKLSSPPQRG
ncbi:MAG: HD domain-containing protein [Deltaproteobacteria bacterium]|nr:HD domain-containing protein [Deltaproteobacteria bacterium]